MVDSTNGLPFWEYPDSTPVYDTTSSDASLAGYQYVNNFDDIEEIRRLHLVVEYIDWEFAFNESQDLLSALVAEAEEDIEKGLAEEIGWDEL